MHLFRLIAGLIFFVLISNNIVFGASYSEQYSPQSFIPINGDQLFSLSTEDHVPLDAAVTRITVRAELYSFSSTAYENAAARFSNLSECSTSTSEIFFQAGSLSGKGARKISETYYTEFDDENANGIWYFRFYNTSDKAYKVETLEVTVYYEIQTYPDLIIQNQTVNPSTVEVGSTINLACDVINQGDEYAGSTYVRYYLSQDTRAGSSDIELGSDYVAALASGSSSSETSSPQIPENISPGYWYILFYADSEQDVLESYENNNISYKGITLQEKKKSNLLPYKPSGWSDKIVISKQLGTNTDDYDFTVNDKLYVDYAYQNNGEAATDRTFYTKIYVDGVSVDTSTQNAPFNSGSYDTVIDENIGMFAEGTHTIRIELDTLGYIDESNEYDNEYTRSFTVSAYNPSIYNVQPSAGIYEIGNDITVQWSTTDIPSDADMKVALKQDSYEGSIENEKYVVLTKQNGVDNPTPNDGSQTFQVPEGLEPADDWQVWVGSYDNLADSVRCNGHLSIESYVCNDVLEPNDTYDSAYSIAGSFYSNNSLCMEIQDKDWWAFSHNSKIYYIKVFSRTSGVYGIRFYLVDNTVTIETVSVNSSDVDTIVQLLDSNGQTMLTYDDNGGSGNFSKIVHTLNSATGKNITYDAFYHSLDVNGTVVNISTKAVNNGDVETGASCQIGYYLSEVAEINTSDYLIYSVSLENLPAGDESIQSVSIDVNQVSPSIPPGTYYIGYYIDNMNQINESDESDNVFCWTDSSQKVMIGPVSCEISDMVAEHWGYDAAMYLCGQGILHPDDNNQINPDEDINRAQLAKMAYFSIDLHTNPAADQAADFPSPYNDLQDDEKWYYPYAINLMYLEYADCKFPFNRDKFNFYPSKSIRRGYVLKVLLETWNVDVISGTDMPYTDVPSDHIMHDYIYTAYKAGFIKSDTRFRPDEYATRAEVFVMLYNIMMNHAKPDVRFDDYFLPGNYTPENLAAFAGLHSGNFNFYSKSSFAISSIGLPLNFSHSYNSYMNEIPDELSPIRPLGHSWTHIYNSYLMDIPGDANSTGEDRVVIMLPGGGINVYKNNGGTYESVTKGVYDELTKPSADQFVLKTKKQIRFTYIVSERKPLNRLI